MRKDRLENLDALRGVAALAVVVFHWTHFVGYAPGRSDPLPMQSLPAFTVLRVLYEQGYRAVDLFFVISGFVFFYLYERPVRQGEVSTGKFGLRRFSRLYPLHVVTLLTVAALQLWFIRYQGHHFVFPVDVSSLFTNLALVNTLNGIPSFNGPAWSVTVECIAYATFYALARRGWLAKPLAIAAVVGVGIGLWFIHRHTGRGITGFFVGGLVFRAFELIGQSSLRGALRNIVVGVTAATWVGCLVLAYQPPLLGRTLASWAINYGVFPLTVLAVALTERQGQWRGKGVLTWLGSISYSSYLIHFPLQLGLAILVAAGVVPLAAMLTPWALAGFLAVVALLASVTYVGFELPMQRLLRQLGTVQPAAGPADVPRRGQ